MDLKNVKTAVLVFLKQKGSGVNQHLRNIAIKAARDIDLSYPGDSYPDALTKLIVKDILSELGKVKWMGDDEGWDKAIEAVVKELQSRYTT